MSVALSKHEPTIDPLDVKNFLVGQTITHFSEN